MNFLKGKLGRSVAVVAFTLGAFQALSIVGALPASAAPTCTYSAGALSITDDVNGTNVVLQQDNNGQVGVGGSFGAVCTGGPILIANLTTVTISGGIGDQEVDLLMSTQGGTVAPAFTDVAKLASWGKVNWTISLGSDNGTSFPNGDRLLILDAATTPPSSHTATSLDLAMGANGIDLNNDGDLDVVVSGIEHYKVESDSAGNDVINAGGSTITGAAFPQALDGLFVGDFGIQADNPVGHATCRLETPPLAAGCHDKTLTGGAGNDRISGTGDGYNTVAPGAGDDFAQGDGDDNLDYSASPNAINANLPGDTVNGWVSTRSRPTLSLTSSVRRRATPCSAGTRSTTTSYRVPVMTPSQVVQPAPPMAPRATPTTFPTRRTLLPSTWAPGRPQVARARTRWSASRTCTVPKQTTPSLGPQAPPSATSSLAGAAMTPSLVDPATVTGPTGWMAVLGSTRSTTARTRRPRP